MSIELAMPSNRLILCCPLLILPSIFPSIRVFSNESVLCIRWPKYWSFSFSISPSNEYSGLVSFGMDWLDLLAVQGTLKSLLQHHCSKALIFQCSAFYLTFIHDYWKNQREIWRESLVLEHRLFAFCQINISHEYLMHRLEVEFEEVVLATCCEEPSHWKRP